MTNRAFLDLRSGDAWDLFFVGMSAYAHVEPDATQLDNACSVPKLYMNHRAFQDVERQVT